MRQVESTLATAAYRLERQDGRFFWHAPPGAVFGNETSEPGASTKTKIMVRAIGPFAPDEML